MTLPTTLGDFHATTIDGKDQDLGTYVGDVVLVVNTASKCGLTPQYEGLQQLHDAYADRGLTVLGFPCDQFGHQEPGTEDEIATFCEQNYGVSFPMFAKIDVNGVGHPPALPVAEEGEERARWWLDQVELHQVPGRPRRHGRRPVRPADRARRARRRHRGPARESRPTDPAARTEAGQSLLSVA